MVAGVLTVSLEFALAHPGFHCRDAGLLFVITLTEAAEAGAAAAGAIDSRPKPAGSLASGIST